MIVKEYIKNFEKLGFVLFGEKLNFIKILRLVLMISACIIISVRKCDKKIKNNVGFSLPLWLLQLQ